MALPLGVVVDMAGGVLFAALAVLVWRLGPAHAANRAFAAFAAAFAAWVVWVHLGLLLNPGLTGPTPARALLSLPLALATVALTIRLTRYLPWPTTGADRASPGPIRFVPASAMGLYLVLVSWGDFLAGGAGPYTSLPVMAFVLGVWAVVAGLGYLAAWMPLRYAQAETPRDRHQAALLGVALSVYPVFYASTALGDPTVPSLAALAAVVMVGTLAGLWLWATRGPGSRTARNAAWLVLGIALAGAVAAATWGSMADSGALGLARAVTVLVIAYGILRHQLLGIDVTVKKGIRRSTLAAIFVAAFFVTSEGAQVLFADFAGSEILGVVAAGALVFLLSPLQRLAGSVAEAAMPHAADPDEMGDDERLEIYRRQAEAAWSDGSLSPDERAMLDDLREHLGLDTDAAAEVESDVAEDVGGDAP